MKVGNPAKPYFLDPDTGSDLTWLQCDAPCKRCTKVRKAHPRYNLKKTSSFLWKTMYYLQMIFIALDFNRVQNHHVLQFLKTLLIVEGGGEG